MATNQQLATSRKAAQTSRRKESVDACQVFPHTLHQHHHQLQLRLGSAVAITLKMQIVLVPTLLTKPWTMPMAAASGALKLRDAQHSRRTWLMAMVRRIVT
jgi:hypothetical protein